MLMRVAAANARKRREGWNEPAAAVERIANGVVRYGAIIRLTERAVSPGDCLRTDVRGFPAPLDGTTR
jgi:hypothetical protein